ncbi:hypothetical protein AOLI_G00243060 [Acnodon oligacanthus]
MGWVSQLSGGFRAPLFLCPSIVQFLLAFCHSSWVVGGWIVVLYAGAEPLQGNPVRLTPMSFIIGKIEEEAKLPNRTEGPVILIVMLVRRSTMKTLNAAAVMRLFIILVLAVHMAPGVRSGNKASELITPVISAGVSSWALYEVSTAPLQCTNGQND